VQADLNSPWRPSCGARHHGNAVVRPSASSSRPWPAAVSGEASGVVESTTKFAQGRQAAGASRSMARA